MTRFTLSAVRLSGLVCALAALMAITAGGAMACAICLSAVSVTIGQRLDAADDVVLAVRSPDGEQFRVIEVIKGSTPVNEIIAESVDGVDAAALRSGKPLLLRRNAIAERWTTVGVIAAQHADWLRRLAKSNRGSAEDSPRGWPQTILGWSNLSDADWAERIVLIEPYLESEEPLAAEIAFGELARAPYSAMRILEPALDARKIRAWIDDAQLAPRRAAYLLLLGIAGGSDDAAALEGRLAEAWASHDATNLSAMLAADLELRGPSRVAWIEKAYFDDGDRTVAEIEAALLALSVHGSASGTVPRQRVVDAYRSFIRARPPMAGFVAKDLADWQALDAVPDYLAVIQSGAVRDPAGQFAIALYLQQSSDPAVEAALAKFAEKAD